MSKYVVISSPYFPVFGLNTGKYVPEITPYLGTFHAVSTLKNQLIPFNSLWPFLVRIKTNGGNFGTVNNARSAFSKIISTDSIQCVCRFMKGIFDNEPPKPKYDIFWHLDIILNFIKKWEVTAILLLKTSLWKTLFWLL